MISMRSAVFLALLGSSTRASADDASHDLVLEYMRLAQGAATSGDCPTVRELGDRVRALDSQFYISTFIIDPAIATCLPPPSQIPGPAPLAPPVVLTPPGTVEPIAPPRMQPVSPPLAPPFRPDLMSRPPIPELDGGRIVGEVLLGYLGGFVGILGGGLIGAATCNDSSSGDEFGCLGPILIGAAIGGTLTMAAGVYVVGSSGNQGGSYAAALGGTVLGGLLGIVVAAAGDGNSAGALLGLSMPMVGALIGFNASRHWDEPPPVGSLVRLDRGRISLGVPLVLHTEIRGAPTTTLSLVSGSF